MGNWATTADLDYPLSNRQLDTLVVSGAIDLPHPLQAGTLTVRLIARREQYGGEWLQVESDGLRGAITRRGATFYGTLATRMGMVAISGQSTATRLSHANGPRATLPLADDDARVPP